MLQEEGEEVAVEMAVKYLQPNRGSEEAAGVGGELGTGQKPTRTARAAFIPMSLNIEHARTKNTCIYLLLI